MNVELKPAPVETGDLALDKAVEQIERTLRGELPAPAVKTFFDEPTFTATHVVHDPATNRRRSVKSLPCRFWSKRWVLPIRCEDPAPMLDGRRIFANVNQTPQGRQALTSPRSAAPPAYAGCRWLRNAAAPYARRC